MTDKMREQFEKHAYCWAASFTRSGEEYCDDEVNSAWLYFKAGAAWQAAQSELDRLRKCEDALKQMLWIVHDSSGVAGYHLNGAIAEWESFPEYHAALAAIAAEGEKE